ncbi:MAG: hypothetical protein VKK04_19895 [Synechococcales bacterium]|nr:hypothetical protein [Synechococcales bacterium]
MKPSIATHQIYFNSAYLGSQLSSLQLPEQCYLLGLVREDRVYTLADNPEIAEQDWLIAVALSESLLPELELYLKQTKAQ